jgi:L-arabinose isomerase
LALTLELYETLAPGLRISRENWLRREVLPLLGRENEVIFNQACYGREMIEAVVGEYLGRGVDVLVVILLTYAPSQLALPVLRRCGVPVVIWNTQELGAVGTEFTPAQMIDNHGVHGTQDLACVLVREGVPFHYVTSAVDDAAGVAELGDYCRAAMACGRLRRARVGCLGYPFPGMGDFAVDTTRLAGSLGCGVVPLSVEEHLRRFAGAKAGEVADLVAEYGREYAVEPGIEGAELAAAARTELAWRGMVREGNLDAITYQFLALGDDERTETLPFVGASRLMAEGIGFAGEGDVVGALGSALLGWVCPPATFSEMFTIDFAGESVFMSHMGEANVAMARRDRKVALVARPTPITRTRGRQLVLVTSLEPGEATLAALVQGARGRWRIVASRVEVLDFGPLAGFCVPHFKVKVEGGVNRFLTAYAAAGGPHHNAVCFGDARRRLRFVAEQLGADYVEV